MSKKKTKVKTAEKKVKITPAKGRPMIGWVGKRPLANVTAFPAQHIETFDPADTSDIETNKLFHGDNKEVLAYLLANGYRGEINLIYIDPPFDSGADYVKKINLRGAKGQAKIEGEDYSLGEQIQYTDIWANDNYLQFIYERLLLLKELLTEDGFILIHLNSVRVHYVKAIADEVFGTTNFRNEIIVKRIRKSYVEKKGISSLNEGVDYLLLYSKSPKSKFEPPMKYNPKKERWHGFDAPNIRKNLTYELFGKMPPSGRCWMKSPEEAQKMIKSGDLRANPDTGTPEYWLEATEHISRDSLWDDITASAFTTGYPTEKKESMLDVIISTFTSCDSVVLDCFIGSGTTAAVAQRLGRRWIGCDINKGAVQTTSKRLQKIILEQIKQQKKKAKQPKFIEDSEEIKPASLAFSVYRVNDYDLQIQHNEAVNLACEHIGIERKKTDIFFEGTLGKKLVKIIPFNHPLSPVDLEEIKKELEERPDEDRAITVVCLGIEIAAKGWIEEWNRLRKGKNAVNKIDAIELRSNVKYGGFIKHEPAKAKIKLSRKKNKVEIEIEDFISPTIIQRLQKEAGILKPKIDDWRSMVDCVMIDVDYNGKIFNISLSDVPEKKNDLVGGRYELQDVKKNSTIAVKIIDMLGEEVLIIKTV